MGIDLPKAIENSQDFLELSEEEKKAFLSRLEYIKEITESLDGFFKNTHNGKELKDFLDDLELDVCINQKFSIEEGEISVWQVHSAWGES
ncbi:MAG: hypothetical protein ACLFRB_03400 [Thiohalorhabdus sp.]|uniref:hypothetical protein n=1 Tax=Thiohalorhabdus sp. TaxID=3094134 RepID=UPI00397FE9C2